MEIIGKVHKVLKEVNGVSKAGREWRKQDAVIVVNEESEYPSFVAFNMFGDKIIPLKEGEKIKLFYNIDSREYKDKWYTNISMWKIEKISSAATGSSDMPSANSDMPSANADMPVSEPIINGQDVAKPEAEDLPF